jgi:hypothetical protein
MAADPAPVQWRLEPLRQLPSSWPPLLHDVSNTWAAPRTVAPAEATPSTRERRQVTSGNEVALLLNVKLVPFDASEIPSDAVSVFSTTNDMNGRPMVITVGNEQTIRGLDEALLGLYVGDHRVIRISSAAAFGHYGNTHGFHGMGKPIPPAADLYCDVFIVETFTHEQVMHLSLITTH